MHTPTEDTAILRRMKRRGYVYQEITMGPGYCCVAVWGGRRQWNITCLARTALAACREVERQWRERKDKP
jgi:hypothetical protein